MNPPSYQSARVILNGRAGTILATGVENARESVERAFREAGIALNLIITDGEGLDAAIREAARGPEEAVIVGGGDGTVRAAARRLLNSGKALGVVPLGTFNLLARDLGMPLDLDEAVAAILRARPRQVDAAEVNGELFLCVSIIGVYPYVAKKREEWRGRPAWRRYPALIRELCHAATNHSSLTLKLKSGDGVHRHVRTRFAAVTNNPYRDAFGLIAKRESLDGGRVAAYVSTHKTRAGLVWSVTRWFFGRWQQDRELRVLETEELTITSRRRKIEAVVDGDVQTLETPLRFKILPRALTVLEPPAPEEEKAADEEPEEAGP